MYRQLDRFRVPPEFETVPTAAYACPKERWSTCAPPQYSVDHPNEKNLSSGASVEGSATCSSANVPKLLKTYLALGARIAAPPAWDREFRTIDFLTLLDLQLLAPAARERFFGRLNP